MNNLISNLGDSVMVMHSLPYRYPGFKDDAGAQRNIEHLNKRIQKFKFGHMIIITANYGQVFIHSHLKDAGFIPITTFYSAHNTLHETLTFWILSKTDKTQAELQSIEFYDSRFPYNCSVRWMNSNPFDDVQDNRQRLFITRTGNLKDMKEYVQVLDTPIWYKIDKRHLVPEDKIVK